MFATNFGSIDTVCPPIDGGEPVKVPDGTAHFLEHKLFENEDGDAFARYAETGADANAFTSFDKTEMCIRDRPRTPQASLRPV